MDTCTTGSCITTDCCSHSTGCTMTDRMLQMADTAWDELMKEKIKAHFEKHRGKHMDKMAEAAAMASITYWENKIGAKFKNHEAAMKIKEAFMK